MTTTITITFDEKKQQALFHMDISQNKKPDKVGRVMGMGFPMIPSIEQDKVFAMFDGENTTVPVNMNGWRHNARRIEHSLKNFHLFDISEEDATIVFQDKEGNVYQKVDDLPVPPDVTLPVGQVTINDYIRVMDPCYKWGEHNDAHTTVLPGEWVFELTLRDDNESGMGNGHRNARFTAYHVDHRLDDADTFLKGQTQDTVFTHCDVDSGTCGFFFDQPIPSEKEDSTWYDRVIDQMHSYDKYTTDSVVTSQDHAAVAATFLGDGGYPVFVQRNDNGQATAIVIVTDYEDPALQHLREPENDFDMD